MTERLDEQLDCNDYILCRSPKYLGDGAALAGFGLGPLGPEEPSGMEQGEQGGQEKVRPGGNINRVACGAGGQGKVNRRHREQELQE